MLQKKKNERSCVTKKKYKTNKSEEEEVESLLGPHAK